MSSLQRITRSDHVASLTLPPGRVARVFGRLRRADVLLRIGICLLAAVCMWLITCGWRPPFGYRIGYLPDRDICASVAFSVPDPEGTERLREKKRSEVTCTYVHDDRPLKELRSALKSRVFQVLAAESTAKVDTQVWAEFLPAADAQKPDEPPSETAFLAMRTALQGDSDLTLFARAVQRAFQQFEETGLLERLGHPPEDGSQISVKVYPLGKPDFLQLVDVKRVRIAEVTTDLKARLAEEFRQAKLPSGEVELLADLVNSWLTKRGLVTTLALDTEATRRDYAEIRAKVFAQYEFSPGDKLVQGGRRITLEKLEVLRREYAAVLDTMTAGDKLAYSAANFGMYAALFLFCGVYVLGHHPAIIADLRQLVTLLSVVVGTAGLGRLCSGEPWQAEVIPVMLFGMTVAIAFSRELALLLSAAVALTLCLSLGMGVAEFVLMVSTGSAAILLLNRIRSRTKLMYVGLGAALVAILTTVGIGTLIGEPLGSWSTTRLLAADGWTDSGATFLVHLFVGAMWHGFCAVLAALIMTGLLPFIERLFDVQTDISLLELGDAAHPLLQELARRAPGTYNHSINVASLAEAAAESIGANSLLVRVGAYFHDIGKVFKPGYFVENQGRDVNRHDSLLPAMSTLVIFAHVKDGGDLARQNRLPKPIIDFIEQHHGTTLVEYFYQQAAKQSENDPDKEVVEESSFRYPGPKPQTREAGVLMLADAAESASRTLVDPTPARIENLVEGIAMKRLLDGQFDDCGITLQELSRIRESLVKLLSAVYHARVKYPDQQTA
ncbi:MAG: HD family phosphohydrolase [Pirellulaceae bacterium]